MLKLRTHGARMWMRSHSGLLLLAVVFLIGVVGVGTGWYLISAPATFPSGQMVQVEEGQPLSVLADRLAEQGVIRAPFLFSTMLRVIGKDNDIDSGVYVFETPQTLIGVGIRLVKGEFGFAARRVTLTEGMTVREMATVLKEAIPDFNAEAFIEQGTQYEGYLFPDTYFLMPDTTPEQAIERMRTTFDERIVEVTAELEVSNMTLNDAVILASILEKEGRSFEVRQQIAGVLMNRLEREMPLQVDAVFGYIYNRATYSPTLEDLESDSPYNTYRNEGLPPGAINNPGIEAIRAALTPIPSTHLYYLTDDEGVMHYANTFEEHKANRDRYGI